MNEIQSFQKIKEEKLDLPMNQETNNNLKIQLESPDNIKNKKLKIKAYCSDCYQFFHNSPFSKICIKHNQKKCNIIPCQKSKNNTCVRKFSNKNSANRHTYCLTKEDIIDLDKDIDIKHCLGQKRQNEKNEENDSGYNTYENVHKLIEQIDHVNFKDEPDFFDVNFNHFNAEEYQPKYYFGEIKNKISDEETIENFFEEVKKNSNISNSVKKKLIKAFKNKGIHNIRVLKLFKDKYKNWDFLVNFFKDVTSQIEGVSLCIEYLLN